MDGASPPQWLLRADPKVEASRLQASRAAPSKRAAARSIRLRRCWILAKIPCASAAFLASGVFCSAKFRGEYNETHNALGRSGDCRYSDHGWLGPRRRQMVASQILQSGFRLAQGGRIHAARKGVETLEYLRAVSAHEGHLLGGGGLRRGRGSQADGRQPDALSSRRL